LTAELASLGGEIITNRTVASLDELRGARTILCDVTPRQLLGLAGARCLHGIVRRLALSIRTVFKLDWALSEAIPWSAARAERRGRCTSAGRSTRWLSEALVWEGRASGGLRAGDAADRLRCQPGAGGPARGVGTAMCRTVPGST
jgi:hypothetical protein